MTGIVVVLLVSIAALVAVCFGQRTEIKRLRTKHKVWISHANGVFVAQAKAYDVPFMVTGVTADEAIANFARKFPSLTGIDLHYDVSAIPRQSPRS